MDLELILQHLNGTYYLVIEDQAGCFADTVFYQVDFISTLENYIFNDLKFIQIQLMII